MKHFIVGPVEMYESTKNIYKKEHPYFRTCEYGEFVKKILSRLQSILGNGEGNSTIYLTMSGTGAMEAVVENCITKSDKSLVINGGTFGKRFCDLLAHHNMNYEEIKLNWDEQLTQKHLEKYDNKDFTTLFVNLHETSTGQLYDINLISDFCKRNNMFLIIDAISTFLADKYNMKEFGADVTIISSQKGLCLSPGLSFVSFSDRMLEKIENIESNTLYFNFKDYFNNIARGQTPYTPAVFIMYEMEAMLDLIDKKGGVDIWISDVADKACYFRQKAKSIGLTIPATYGLSNTMTPVICNDISASDIVSHLRDNYKIYVNPCGGVRAEKMFRVSHIGNITKEDIDELINKISLTIEELKKGDSNDRK